MDFSRWKGPLRPPWDGDATYTTTAAALARQWQTLDPAIKRSTPLLVAVLALSLVTLFRHDLLDIFVPLTIRTLPPSLRLVLWDALVFATPYSLLYRLSNSTVPGGFTMARRTSTSTTTTTKGKAAEKSRALEHLLALDARRPCTAETGKGKAPDPAVRPLGIYNDKNMCFENSTAQALSALRAFCALDVPVAGDTPVFSGLVGMMDQLQQGVSTRATGAAARQALQLARGLRQVMPDHEQQDMGEYLLGLVDHMEKEVAAVQKEKKEKEKEKKQRLADRLTPGPEDDETETKTDETEKTDETDTDSNTDPPFKCPLDTLQVDRKMCTQCKFSPGLSTSSVTVLSLSMPPGPASGVTRVEQLLHDAVQSEAIEGVNCNKCTLLRLHAELADTESTDSTDSTEPKSDADRRALISAAVAAGAFDDATLARCGVANSEYAQTTRATQTAFASAPAALALHLNRTTFDLYTGATAKDTRRVAFAPTLDLAPYCLDGAQTDVDHSVDVASLTPPELETVRALREASRGHRYVLRAVVKHRGTKWSSGHYTAFKKFGVGADETWFHMDDARVTPVDEAIVLSMQAEAYMLFYERVDTPASSHLPLPASSHLPSPPPEATSEPMSADEPSPKKAKLVSPSDDDVLAFLGADSDDEEPTPKTSKTPKTPTSAKPTALALELFPEDAEDAEDEADSAEDEADSAMDVPSDMDVLAFLGDTDADEAPSPKPLPKDKTPSALALELFPEDASDSDSSASTSSHKRKRETEA